MATQIPDSLASFDSKGIAAYETFDDIVNFPARRGMLKLIAQATKDEQNTVAGSPANLKARCEKFKCTNDLLQQELSNLKAALQARMHLKAPDPTQSRDLQLLKERLAEIQHLLDEEQGKSKALEQQLQQVQDEAQKAKDSAKASIDTLEARLQKEELQAKDAKRALSEQAAHIAKVTAELLSAKETLEQTKREAEKNEEAFKEASTKKIESLNKRLRELEEKDEEREQELATLRQAKAEFDLRVVTVGAELRKLSDENERLTSIVTLVRTAVNSNESTT